MDLIQPQKVYGQRNIVVWRPDLETATGGFKLDVTNLPAGTIIPAGTVMEADEVTRIAKIGKSAKVYANVIITDTAIPVAKGHLYVVGEIVMLKEAGKSVTITAIDKNTSNLFDTITVDAALGVIAAGASLVQSKAVVSTTSVPFVKANLLSYTAIIVAVKNTTIDGVTTGTCYARRIPPILDSVKLSLPRITFSNSK